MYLPNRRANRERKPKDAKQSLDQLISSSSHCISRSNDRVRCSNCGNSFSVHDPALKYWLACSCPNSAASSSRAGIPAPARSNTSSAPRPAVSMSSALARPISLTTYAGPVHVGNRIVHSSHNLKTHRGLVYCQRCGYVATTQARALARPCGPTLGRKRTRHGDNILNAVHSDSIPKCLAITEWPDGTK